MTAQKKVLFIGEAVSLAHVARPAVLAQSLDPARYEIHFACDPRYQKLLCLPAHIRFWPVSSSQSDTFIRGSDRGGYVWQPADIEFFVQQERELFRAVNPSLVISDFRMSAAISAELAGIPYLCLVNVYWSPFRDLGFNPVPAWPRSIRLARWLERVLMPWRESSLTVSMNKVRKNHGLPELKGFLDLATRGNYTLYPEPRGFVPTKSLPANHRFIGPILWSPDAAKPSWWKKWDPSRPLLYVTLGSTGAARRLLEIVRALQDLPASIVVSTAGRVQLPPMKDNVFVADYLPGLEICGLADGVVCNGGSATAYQALSQGAPVVGVWSNLDQFLTMTTIERAGAGLCARASNHDATTIHNMVATVLKDSRYRDAARRLAPTFSASDAPRLFPDFIAGLPELRDMPASAGSAN